MVEVKNLIKKYGKHTAVDGLSFTVEKGQIYGFLGPNGAGKSTTMNIMTGYLAATEGDVTINGYDMMKEPEKAKQCIGYLPEVPPVYPDMTVLEYLKFAAELKRIPKAERRRSIEKVMELVRITEVSERLIKNLSKGYRQRVGLSQAILGDPEVIILDEPMVGLDPRQIIEMRDLIKGLGKEHTVILSSHILSEISAVCDHILIISNGKLAASGSPEELQSKMRGSSVLEATIKASMEELQKVLKEIKGIEKVEQKAPAMGDCVTVLISTADGIDIREELSMKLYENKLPIMGMNLQEHSLEDIFLELTEKDTELPADISPEEGNGEEENNGNGKEEGREGENKKDHKKDISNDVDKETGKDISNDIDKETGKDSSNDNEEKQEGMQHDGNL